MIKNSKAKVPNLDPFDSITGDFCKAYKGVFDDKDDFNAKGGLASMSKAMDRGMVLVMSLWDDHMADMLWLDSNYPTDKKPETPGVARGTCDAASGKPEVVEAKSPHASVEFSNIKIGDIDSTYGANSASAGTGGSNPTAGTNSTSTTVRQKRVRRS